MASLVLPAGVAPQVLQLYQFTYPIAVENLSSLPNGCLLLSTSTDADLYYIDPEADFPAAQHVITLPGSIRLTGIAALGDNSEIRGLHANIRYQSPDRRPRECHTQPRRDSSRYSGHQWHSSATEKSTDDSRR